MHVTKYLILYIYIYIYIYIFYDINDSISKLKKMTNDSVTLLKNHVICNFMLKYYITMLL